MRSIYKTDKVELFHGDSLEVMRQMNLAKYRFDAIITDPPYCSGGMQPSQKRRSVVDKYSSAVEDLPSFLGDFLDQRNYLGWSRLWLAEARSLTKDGGDLFSFIDWRQLPTLSDALQLAGWLWKNVGVWNKNYGRPMKGTFSAGHEFILHGVNGSRPPVERYAPAVFAEKTPSSKVHLSQKPVPVMEWIMNLTAPDALILDPFAGSGSTLVAAVSTRRKAIGIEADPTHLQTIVQRLEETQKHLSD